MKKIMGILLGLLMLIGLAQATELHTCEFDKLCYTLEPIKYECGDFIYTLNAHGNARIVDYTGDAIDLVFPSEIDGHPVTSIFSTHYESNVRTVHIPEGVTVLGFGVLTYCRDLETVFLPSTLRAIGTWAFGCSNVRNIHLPENLIYIEDEAFDYCTEIPAVTLPSDLCYLGDMTFNNHGSSPRTYFVAYSDAFFASQFADLVIDEASVNAYGDYLYQINDDGSATIVQCYASGDVVVPETLDGHRVTAIGKGAFISAFNMKTLVLPQTVTSIGIEAFRRCDKLTSVVLPANLVEIGEAAFAYCTALTDISLPQGITTIEDFAFFGCSSLRPLAFPATLEHIERYAFYGCYEEMEIPSVSYAVEIGENAFYPYEENLIQYEDVTWWDKEETDREARKAAWDTYASPENFQYELNDDGTITITKYTGEGQNVHIPEKIDGHVVTSIGKFAFAGLSFNQFTFPDTITSIGDGAFCSCWFEETLILPKRLKTIGNASFCGISTLQGTQLVLPDTLISIGDYAFYHAYLEEELMIPASVAEIGEWAFAVPQFGNDTFVLLCSDVQIGENAFDSACELTVQAGSPLVQYCLDSGISCIEYEVEIHTGDILTFGSCNEEKLSWIVLRSDEETTTMICEHVVGIMPFGRKNNEWSSSRIRSWLNDEFASAAFNETERSALVPVRDDLVRIPGLNDLLNDEYGFSTDRDTADPLRTAFGFGGSIANHHMLIREKHYPYYTLTAASDRSLYQVRANGSIGMAKYDRDNVGIRPVITVKTEALK